MCLLWVVSFSFFFFSNCALFPSFIKKKKLSAVIRRWGGGGDAGEGSEPFLNYTLLYLRDLQKNIFKQFAIM